MNDKLKFNEFKNKNILLNITLTSNNSIISIADLFGNILHWESCGSIGFKGSKRKSTIALEQLILKILKFLFKNNLLKVILIIKGGNRKNINLILRPLFFSKLKIINFIDYTPIPFNGCRLPKPKRANRKKNLFLF